MTRLIDADALLNDISDLKKSPWFHENYFDHKNIRKEAIEIVEQLCIDKAPTIDAVPVVRCKDCKCWTEWSNGTGSCSRFALDWIGTDADDFCSMGERKDDE